MNSGSQEPRTAQCSLRVSGSLQPRGRWARSGSQQSAGYVGVALRAGAGSPGASPFDEREQFACEAVSSGSQQFAGVGGVAGSPDRAPGGGWQSSPRAAAVSAGSLDLAEREHFDGCAGRHGEEQRAPGGWRAPRPLPGALRQVRKFHRCVSENLTSLSSSLVPHALCFLSILR